MFFIFLLSSYNFFCVFIQTKMLRHYPAIKKYANEQSHTKPCLVELSFGIALDGVLLAKGTPSLEKIQLNVNDTKAVVHGGLYDFIRDAKLHKKNLAKLARPVRSVSFEKETKLNEENVMTDDDLYERISPIIPKVIIINLCTNVVKLKCHQIDLFL